MIISNTDTKVAPVEFQVEPEVGLKNDRVQFALGMPINQALAMINENSDFLHPGHLTYSRNQPFVRDICVQLVTEGLRLFFDAQTQLLQHIDVYDLSNIILSYRGKRFSEPANQASMDKVDEHFGSTHPGEYDEEHGMYVQSWRGLSFCFPTNDNSVQVTPSFVPNLRSLKYDSNSQPRLTKMSLFRGPSMNKTEPVTMPAMCYCGQNKTDLIEVQRKQGRIAGITVHFRMQVPIPGKSSPRNLDDDYELDAVEKFIPFGASVSDVMCALGAPTKVFYKSEDKMSIHRGATKETLPPRPHFFFNYFSMGFDVLFDFHTKRVIKFVLHNNIPGHYDFGIYSRCAFRVYGDLSDGLEINHHSQFSDVAAVFCDGNDRPVVVRRSSSEDRNPFPPTYCYGTKQLVVEVMENSHFSSITLYDDKL